MHHRSVVQMLVLGKLVVGRVKGLGPLLLLGSSTLKSRFQSLSLDMGFVHNMHRQLHSFSP